jgi:outer membrane protein OmpA-like peptidoglycan-associated protein
MEEYTQLRNLLLDSEQQRLEQLEIRFNDYQQRTHDVAEVLPSALRFSPNQADLISALQAPVDNCVKQSVQQDPKTFAKAIMPVMVPVLRKNLADAFKSIREFLHEQQANINQLDNRISQLEQGQITDLLNRLSYIEQAVAYLNDIEQRINMLERSKINQLIDKVSDIDNQVNTLEQEQINQLVVRCNDLEQNLDQLETTLTNSLEQRIHTLERSKISLLVNKVSYIDNHVNNLEQEQINKLIDRLAYLEQNLSQLETALGNEEQRVDELVKFLPKAIRQATQSETTTSPEIQLISNEKEEELTDSLQMPIEYCLKSSVERDAHSFADILFPVMGPAIRKSINETFKAIVQNINTSLERSLSLQGLNWRLEAWQSGRPFSDIVLQNTLVYRVEQVFLIHRETGLLMQHQSQDGTQIGDSEAISGMLTAIQDFIRDSFSTEKTAELESVEVGDYTVWIERGPYAVLAGVIRGVAPYEFKTTMRMNLEAIHARYGKALRQFTGDSAPLEPCKPLLQKTLQAELKPEVQAKKNRLFSPAFLVVLGILVSLLLAWGYIHWRYQQRLDEYVNRLRATPGITLIATNYQGGKLIVQGLRDPLATDPHQIAQQLGLTEQEITGQWQFYQDLHPQIVEQRLRQWLAPPKTVQLAVTDSVLYLRGHADQDWINKVNNQGVMALGISRIDTNKLIDNHAFFSQTQAEFDRYLKALQNTPGIVITSNEIEGNQRIITGLRDPLAEDPLKIAKRLQITDIINDNLVMRWHSYQDLTPDFVAKRLQRRLTPPATVKLQLKGDVLSLRGHASQAWIDKATREIQGIAGINQINRDLLLETDQFLLIQAQNKLEPPPSVTLTVNQGVLKITGYADSNTIKRLQQGIQELSGFASIDTQELVDLNNLIHQIDQLVIYFDEGTKLKTGQQPTLQLLQQSLQQLQAIQADFTLQIIGNTDGLGAQKYNQDLSRRRAKSVYQWLIAQGITARYLAVVFPTAIRFGKHEPNWDERKVTFRVVIKKSSNNKDSGNDTKENLHDR